MTEDLVKRLRTETNGKLRRLDANSRWGMMIVEAADLIEELEKRLAASNKQIKELENDIKNLEYKMFGLESHT